MRHSRHCTTCHSAATIRLSRSTPVKISTSKRISHHAKAHEARRSPYLRNANANLHLQEPRKGGNAKLKVCEVPKKD